MPIRFFHGDVWKKNTYIHTFANNLSLWFKHCAYFKKVPYAWHGGKFFSFKNWKNVLGKKLIKIKH